jgi:indolepyruvate ferredoxin oxidoreductase
MGEGRTYAAINSTTSPTASFIKNPNWQFPESAAEKEIRDACGPQHVDVVDAGNIATALLGDAIATNMFMLGYAWQKGWVPLTEAALTKAIELNAVSVRFNNQAFLWGRRAAHDLASVQRLLLPAQVVEFKHVSLDELIANRMTRLEAYQNAAYASEYREFVEQVRSAEAKLGESRELTTTVARYLYKLMAYKDEYEVARLHTSDAFSKKIAGLFEGDVKLKYHLAPPLLAKRDSNGHLVKQEFGPWMKWAFGVLAKLKSLRGTPLDIFGYTSERKMERALIGEYRQTVMMLLAKLNDANLKQAVAIAAIPEEIRGYGHVKERHVATAKKKQAELIATYRA